MPTTRAVLFSLLAALLAGAAGVMLGLAQPAEEPPQRLAVVWSSGDPDVAHRVCLMYTHASARSDWFDETHLIVWGPSARLLAADKDLQAKVKVMMEDGVTVVACQACADSYGVSDSLRALGIEVKYMGKPLSDMLQDDWKVLAF